MGWARGLAAAALLAASPALATVCNVPGTYTAVGDAVAVPACNEIVMAAGTFTEQLAIGRSLTLRGAGASTSTLRGRIVAQGGAAAVQLEDFTIETGDCFAIGLEVSGAASQTSSGTVAVRSGPGGFPCPLYRDGFEAGSGAHWSAALE